MLPMMAGTMKFPTGLRLLLPLLIIFFPAFAAAEEKVLQSTSLNSCQDQSGFTASLFHVVYTPKNNTAAVNMQAISTIEGNVQFDISIRAYGYEIIRKTLNPCDAGLIGFCPMTSGKTSNPFNIPVSPSAASQIPNIAYGFPDLDAKVQVFINYTDGAQKGQPAACLEAQVSNGKTVDLIGVKWASGVVAGLALASSALLSGLGHTNAASHVAANALSLCSYFQAQAMVGMVGIPLPPVVQSWTQDFQWSMGIIKVDWMQRIFTWYQRATGGSPSTLFSSLATASVQVQKRSLDLAQPSVSMFDRATAMLPRELVKHASVLAKRGNIKDSSGSYVVYGVQRVAFRAGIESTNLFITGLIFFCIFVVLTSMVVTAFKYICEAAVKAKWMEQDTFSDFRHGWIIVLKGILYRITLIGFAPITILSLWELTQKDSPAEVVLAVFFFIFVTATLGWASWKVIRIAKRSVNLHKNPAYILFSDAHALNKWGFLYIQFRASAYYFIVPVLGYTLLKAMFIAFSQGNGVVQAIALILIEVGALVGATVMRPWMDKSTNSFNIAICVVNFINSICLLIFTDIFNQPALFTGIVGLFLWILNAVTTLVLLLMLIISTIIIFFHGNPDGRYQYMGDDRTSFMKSQSQLHTTTELDALAATARGDKEARLGSSRMELDDDEEDSVISTDRRRRAPSAPQSTRSSLRSVRNAPVSPTAAPMLPVPGDEYRAANSASPGSYGKSNSSGSPWQRGAGYDEHSGI